MVASLVPRSETTFLACWQRSLAAWLASHTLVSWSQILFVMMLGFRASCCPLALLILL